MHNHQNALTMQHVVTTKAFFWDSLLHTHTHTQNQIPQLI